MSAALNKSRPGGRAVGTTRGEGRSIGKRVCLMIDLPLPRCHGFEPWLPGRLALHHRMEPDPKNPCHPCNPCPTNVMCDGTAMLCVLCVFAVFFCDDFVIPSCLGVFVFATARWCDVSVCDASVSLCLCGLTVRCLRALCVFAVKKCDGFRISHTFHQRTSRRFGDRGRSDRACRPKVRHPSSRV